MKITEYRVLSGLRGDSTSRLISLVIEAVYTLSPSLSVMLETFQDLLTSIDLTEECPMSSVFSHGYNYGCSTGSLSSIPADSGASCLILLTFLRASLEKQSFSLLRSTWSPRQRDQRYIADDDIRHCLRTDTM